MTIATPYVSGVDEAGNYEWTGTHTFTGLSSVGGDVVIGDGGTDELQIYGVGTAGDSNYERIVFGFSNSRYRIVSEAGGTGTARNIVVGSGDGSSNAVLSLDNGTGINNSFAIAGNAASCAIRFDDSGGTSRNAIYVSSGNVMTIGNANYGSILLVNNVSFGGTLTAANLPTSDPAVANQLWNDAGTVKVSAG